MALQIWGTNRLQILLNIPYKLTNAEENWRWPIWELFQLVGKKKSISTLDREWPTDLETGTDCKTLDKRSMLP